MNSDLLLPIIILNPILNDRVSTYTVKLYPYISGEMFKVTKLAPDRNNVRDTSAGEGQGQFTLTMVSGNTELLQRILLLPITTMHCYKT